MRHAFRVMLVLIAVPLYARRRSSKDYCQAANNEAEQRHEPPRPDPRTAGIRSTKIVLLVADGLERLPPAGRVDRTGNRTGPTSTLSPRRVSAVTECSVLPVSPPAAGRTPQAVRLRPTATPIGRGVLEAVGIDLTVCARHWPPRNYCTLDADGKIIDRQRPTIGRPGARKSRRSQDDRIPEVELIVDRQRLSVSSCCSAAAAGPERVNDTDPQAVGVTAGRKGADPASENRPGREPLHCRGDRVLKNERMPTAHSAASRVSPHQFKLKDVYGLTAAAIAVYPLQRGPAGGHGRAECGPQPRRANGHARTGLEGSRLLLRPFQVHGQDRRDGDFAAKVKRIRNWAPPCREFGRRSRTC